MTEDDFMRVGIKLNTIWPGKFPAELLAEWNETVTQFDVRDVFVAIDQHHSAVPFPPKLAEIRSNIERIVSAERKRFVTRTGKYLSELTAEGEKAKAEIEAMRVRLNRLSTVQRLDLLEQALAKLDEEMPALSRHFYTRKEQSSVVLATMVALLNRGAVGELVT